jgi:transcription termination/antitermination protein NusA
MGLWSFLRRILGLGPRSQAPYSLIGDRGRREVPGEEPAPYGEQTMATAGEQQVRRLLTRHVPEIANGLVHIKAIARADGLRTKIAVFSLDPTVDSVRACVGVDAARINKVVDELGGERIDIFRSDDSPQAMIASALAPARTEEVFLHPRLGRAIVLVKDDQLPRAIGAQGHNVKLASKLAGWDIELLTLDELNAAIARAENWFRQLPGSTDKIVDTLIEEGFLRYEDLTVLEPAALAELVGTHVRQAAEILAFAAAAAKRVE